MTTIRLGLVAFGCALAAFVGAQGTAAPLTYESLGPGQGVCVTGLSEGATCTSLTIPAEIAGAPVTQIQSGAFTDGAHLTSVTVPGTVTALDMHTFTDMEGLREVVLREGVRRIGWFAFADCKALCRLVIPASCTDIDPLAFDLCPRLTFAVAPENPAYRSAGGALLSKDGSRLIFAPGGVRDYTVPETVRVVGASFTNPGQALRSGMLASVTLPASVRIVETGAIGGGIGKVHVAVDNPWYASEDGVLYDKKKRALLHVPPTVTVFTVPDTVTRIGLGAFAGGALRQITFSAKGTLREIGDVAFLGCELRTLTLPKGVVAIGEDIVCRCEKLTAITFPETLRAAGPHLYLPSDALRQVTFRGPPPQGCSGIVFPHDQARGTYPARHAKAWQRVLNADGTWGLTTGRGLYHALHMSVDAAAPNPPSHPSR